MNNKTVGAVGISAAIELIKDDVYSAFDSLWNGKFEAYGRMYKLAYGNSWKPYHFIGGEDYKEILMKDEANIMYFEVGDSDSTEDSLVYRSGARVVFLMKLDLAYPNSKIRSDGEAMRDAVEILRDNAFERFQITGIERSLSDIFRGMDPEVFQHFNDHPYFGFAVEIDLDYYLTDKC